jgi:hypothetical protein
MHSTPTLMYIMCTLSASDFYLVELVNAFTPTPIYSILVAMRSPLFD